MAKEPTPKQKAAREAFAARAKQQSVKKLFKPSTTDPKEATSTPAYRTRKRI